MNRVRIFAWLATVLVATLFAPAPASAQYNYYMSSSFLSNQFNYPSLAPTTGSRQSQSSRSAAKPVERAPETKRTGRASATNNPLPYTRDKSVSIKIRDEFLQDFAKQIPDAAGEMRETAERTDLVQVVAGFAQLAGLDSGTMEGMMALWYGQAWAIANQQPMPTSQQYQGIANQLRVSIKNSPKWTGMGNKERQEFIESFAYPLFVQKANYQAYLKQGKKDSMARMASATQEGLKRIGLNLQNLRLSDNGFVGS
jgi:hypothetical protein